MAYETQSPEGFPLGFAEPEFSQQDPGMQSLAAYIQRAVTDSHASRYSWFSEAHLCKAMYAGQHYAYFDPYRGTVNEIPADESSIRSKADVFSPVFDILCSRLSGMQPGWVVNPSSDEEDDKESARLTEQLLDHAYVTQQLSTVTDEVAKNALLTGLGIYRVHLDPTCGEILEDGTYAGQVKITSLQPFDFFVDPGATTLEDAHWVASVEYMHISQVRRRWPEAGAAVAPDTLGTDASALGRVMQVQQSSLSRATDRVAVYSFFEGPSLEHPQGWYAIATEDIILELADYLPGDMFPYAILRSVKIPGQLYGSGYGQRVRSLQVELNNVRSARNECVELQGGAKTYVMAGSVSAQSLTNEFAEVVEYTGQPPIVVPPPPISPEFERIESSNVANIYSICGISELSASSGPIPATLSGLAIARLEENEATRLAPISHDLEQALQRVAQAYLQLWVEYMPQEMTVRVIGETKQTSSLTINKDSIQASDIYVRTGSMTPRLSKSVRQEIVLESARQGGYGDLSDPKNLKQFRKDMEFGDLDTVQGDNSDKHRSYAREENALLLVGAKVDVNPIDMHEEHMDEHGKLFLSAHFRNLDPAAQERVLTHVAKHYAANILQAGKPWQLSYLPPDQAAAVQQALQPAQPQAPAQPQQPQVIPPDGVTQ